MEAALPRSAKTELQSLKARRKELKVEITSWLTAFQAREGRAAEDADKQPISSLYRSRADLEDRINTLEVEVGKGSGMRPPSSEPPPNRLVAPLSVSDFFAPVGGPPDRQKEEEEEEGEDGVRALKARRKELKVEIASWLTAFQAREGRAAEDADKQPISSLYRSRLDLEARIKALEAPRQSSSAPFRDDSAAAPVSEKGGKLLLLLPTSSASTHADEVSQPEDAAHQHQQPAGKFSLEAMRARRVAWMKGRFEEIARELAAEDGAGPSSETVEQRRRAKKYAEAKSPKAAEKWSMLKASVGLSGAATPKFRANAAKAFFNEPPPKGPADPRLQLDPSYVVELEDFLRQPRAPLTVAPRAKGKGGAQEDFGHLLPPIPPPPASYFQALAEAASLLETSASLPLPYAELWAAEAPKQELLVSHIPASALAARESAAAVERARIQSDELSRFRRREEDLKHREGLARSRVSLEEAAGLDKVRERSQAMLKDEALKRGELARAFVRAREDLERRLGKQRAFFKERFGELRRGEGAAARRHKLMWQGIPQAVEVRVHLLASVSSKLKQGSYSVLLSMYDRLGGRLMSWTAFPPHVALLGGGPSSAALPAATKPTAYSGKYYDRELRVEQSVYCLAPSPADVRPSAIFVFELFEMKSPTNPSDKVVGWGAMPICDPHFRTIHGRFKVPLLRGAMDRSITKFSGIEARYAKDLSLWLTNMYIDVRHLPRQMGGKDGVEEEGASEVSADADIEYDHVNLVATVIPSHDDERPADAPLATAEKAVVNKGIRTNSDWSEKAGPIFKSRKTAPSDDKDHATVKRNVGGGGVRKRRKSSVSVGSEDEVLPSSTPSGPQHAAASVAAIHADGGGDSDASDGEDGGRVHAKAERSVLPGAEIVPRGTGKKKNDGSNWTDIGLGLRPPPAKEGQALKFQWHSLTDSNEMELYTVAIAKDPSLTHKPSPDRILSRKLAYLFEELFDDLNIRYVFTFDFFVGLAVFVCAIWLRMYFHYMGEWLFLKANGIPLYSFKTYMWTITIKYTSSNITDLVEVGVVAIGQLTNIAILLCFSSFSVALTVALGRFPVALSKFVFYFGIVTMLDPALIFIVDLCLQNFDCANRSPACVIDYTSSRCQCTIGDSFKLWYRMSALQASGITGVFYTAVIYVLTTLLAAIILYHYVLYVHMDARMLDIHKRINASVDHFFVPEDNEISLEELNYILNRAKNWRAPAGTLRKVHVNEFTVRDDKFPSFFQKVAHIAIFQTEVDGSKTLYRHFLRNANGSIVEIDGKQSQHFSGQLALETLLGETDGVPEINKAKTASGEYIFVLSHGWKDEK